MTRRFPLPWSVRELEQTFVVEDATGQAVAYTYFRRDPNEARQANVCRSALWSSPARASPTISPTKRASRASRYSTSVQPAADRLYVYKPSYPIIAALLRLVK
jgi:hypothetical protein